MSVIIIRFFPISRRGCYYYFYLNLGYIRLQQITNIVLIEPGSQRILGCYSAAQRPRQVLQLLRLQLVQLGQQPGVRMPAQPSLHLGTKYF